MKKLNVSVLEKIVGTKYGDMTGLIQIDGHNNVSEINKLCQEKGIEMEEYFLVGFGFSEFTTSGVGSRDNVHCSVLLLDKAELGETFDQIKSKISTMDEVELIKKTFEIKYAEFGRFIKRVDTMLLTDLGNYICNAKIVENDEE
jgi:hypothetical protein